MLWLKIIIFNVINFWIFPLSSFTAMLKPSVQLKKKACKFNCTEGYLLLIDEIKKR